LLQNLIEYIRILRIPVVLNEEKINCA